MLSRYNLFSKRRDNIFPFGESVQPPSVSTELVDRVGAEERARAKVASQRTEGAGRDTSFYQYERALLRFPVLGEALNLINYAVPSGRVLEVQKVDFVLSEPWLYGSNQIGWRIAINAEQINNQGSLDGVRDDYLLSPIDRTPGNNSEFFPVFVRPPGTFQVQIVEIPVIGAISFDEMVWVSVSVTGRLRKPAGGKF